MEDVKIVVTFIILFLLFTTIQTTRLYRKQLQEKNRLERSLMAANRSVTYYKTMSGQLAVRNETLHLTYQEVRKIYPGILSEIQNLKIKIRHVSNYSETVINHEKEIITPVRDSIINDTVTANVFNYHDEFYQVRGILAADTQRVLIRSVDSLIQAVYKGKRYKPYLWILSRRRLEQAITSKNPNSKIIYSKYIDIIN